jgi:hypothetical protein
MTRVDQWFCNECARKAGVLPPPPATYLLASPYQRQKFKTHTVGDPAAPRNSVYNNPDPTAYEESVTHTVRDGALQIDDKGRRNVFRAVNQPVGITYTAHQQTVVSGEKVVLGDDCTRIHGFPYGNTQIPHRTCTGCGRQIPW